MRIFRCRRSRRSLPADSTRAWITWATLPNLKPSSAATSRSSRTWSRPMACPQSSSSACTREVRSEEHTSELQSHLNLVCRLLLEKKKQNKCQLRDVHDHRCAAVVASLL